jgi:hypothetical protein
VALKTSIKERPERISKTFRTRTDQQPQAGYTWWLTKDPGQRAKQIVATVSYLKQGQLSRGRQAAIFARLYGGQSVINFVGSSMSRVDPITTLAPNRPTYNLISSVCDTLVSRLSQSRPSPTFLTDNGNYKSRLLAKKLTSFIGGEFYQTKAYDRGAECLLDALVEGTGCLKVYETADHKVGIERVLLTELFVDLQEAAFGDPRRLYQLKLVDREVLASQFPKFKSLVAQAEKASLDNSGDSSKSVSDMVMVVEGWALPSGEDTGDAKHTIACSAGELFSEDWDKDRFPFVFLHHHRRQLGFWSMGVAEALFGTQYELNMLLDTISKSIRLVGVPRVFVEEGSKTNKAAFNNKIGVIIPYRGTKPSYEVASCVPQEMYAERDRIIQYGYQQEGLSFMGATSQKPAGLDSGEAIRSYDDITSDRFASLARRYDNLYVDLAYLVIDKAVEIAKREGKYQTIYPDRRGTKTIDLPKLDMHKDPFVIQCFNESSLPRDPAGRKQTIVEHVQSGMLTIQEGRRLLNFPDLEQVDTLAIAAEERIYCYLDKIVEDGEYTPPDPFMNISLGEELSVQYYNLYVCRGLEEERAEMLRTFHDQCGMLKMEATQGAMPPAPMPTAQPEPTPTSPVVNNTAGAQMAAA